MHSGKAGVILSHLPARSASSRPNRQIRLRSAFCKLLTHLFLDEVFMPETLLGSLLEQFSTS